MFRRILAAVLIVAAVAVAGCAGPSKLAEKSQQKLAER